MNRSLITGLVIGAVVVTAGGAIAGYRMYPFMRLGAGGHERLVPVEALTGRMKGKVEERLKAIFGD